MTEYSNNCRICLIPRKREDNDDFESIYKVGDEQKELTELGQMYQELFHLLVAPDKTPQFFCNYCTLQLRLFHKFRNRAVESYRTFMQSVCKQEIISESGEDFEIEPQVELLDERNGDHSKFETRESISDDCGEFEEVQYLEEYLSGDEDDWKELDMYDESSNNENSENNFCDDNGIQIKRECEGSGQDKSDYEGSREEVSSSPENPAGKSSRMLIRKANKMSVRKKSKRRGQRRNSLKRMGDCEDLDYENHVCPYCGEAFNTKYALVVHKKKDHPRTKYSCKLCPKVFYSEETLRVHINVHNGLPAYQCEECEKTFKQKAHYVYHMMGHRNERNVQCHLCGKGFLNNSDLRIHLRVHNDERRYECDVCNKRFRAHTHMTNHRYSHFEKQLQCEICLQKYSSPNTLRTHIKAVHKNECPYECETCQRRFKRKHHLKAHYKIHQKTRIFIKNETIQLI